MLSRLLKGFRSLIKPAPTPDWDFSDRRTLVRVGCAYEVVGHSEGEIFASTVVDLGVLGLRLRTERILKVGKKIKLSWPEPPEGAVPEAVDCQVIWSNASEAGLIYTGDAQAMRRSWVTDVLRELGFTPDSIYSKRRFVRADCLLTGQLSAGHEWSYMQVSNLGIGGALLESGISFTGGDFLKLLIGPYEGLPLLSAGGRIVRVGRHEDTFLYGVEFEEMPSLQVERLGKYLRALLSRI